MKEIDELKPLLDSGIINEETRVQIQEAWDTRLNESRDAIRAELREEFSRRYEHDKNTMVESLDKMVNDKLTEELSNIADERKKLEEDRVKFNVKMTEQSEKVKDFMLNKLGDEMKKLKEDRDAKRKVFESDHQSRKRDREQARIKMNEQTNKVKNFMLSKLGNELSEFNSDRKVQAENMIKVKAFVVNALSEEIAEFHKDKKAVIEARVKLVAEGKQQIETLKKNFIERSSRLVKETVRENLNNELNHLKEDIDQARRNKFGRKLFETFAAEFATSHLNENSDIREMQTKIEAVEKQLQEAKQSNEKKSALIESKEAENRRINNRIARERKLTEMLTPLNKEQKTVMQDLLVNVKTSELNETFNKYLSTVLKEEVKKPNARRPLNGGNEGVNEFSLTETKEITGDKKSVHSIEHEGNITEMQRLAGITKDYKGD